ncbi:MAG: KH domain-containing protein [Verrucomicrobia bacterium]|nr:KH domain-containing protein [Verrucomicrobiota bacterium]MBS0645094.1 KH domain-containing protein [Verrucomicrobiota bacterium]
MEEFVAYIIKNLVSQPEAVNVSSKPGQEALTIEIRVASEDVGKMIGRKGNTINALRTIVRTVATRLGQKVQVELIQPERTAKLMEMEPEEEAMV